MNCFGRLSNRFASEGCPMFYRNSVVCFQEQIVFVLKTDYFCDAPNSGGLLTTRQPTENLYVSYHETHI